MILLRGRLAKSVYCEVTRNVRGLYERIDRIPSCKTELIGNQIATTFAKSLFDPFKKCYVTLDIRKGRMKLAAISDIASM